jgi:16S rRNA (cytosine1402-N4)-methyltransferase
VHEPVLAGEVVAMLAPHRTGTYVDATVGLGGHAAAILAAGAERLVGIDRDETALAEARQRLAEYGGRVTFVHDDFRHLAAILDAHGAGPVAGILADLGVSSMQLDEADRGFSFRQAGPLDMRMDRSRGLPLAARLAEVDETTLADVIWRYGEERRSRRVARAILAARDRGALTDTAALATEVRRGVGQRGWQRIDPATRTFQALRIWVNDELGAIETFIDAAWTALGPGGRLAIIAFHSLEDRLVKQAFRARAASGAAALLTRRPVVAGPEEQARNPRSRSARLRVAEKVA